MHRMRAPGLTWFRLPLFVWAHYATSLIMILGTPVIAITVLLVAAERVLHMGIFDPALGGDPVLFQHLFWFYSHPAVYIMILPAMGVISEIVQAFSRKNIFGYSFIAFSSLAIAVIGFLVWGHHLFVAGQSVYAGLIFSFISFLVAIPSAIKVFNWTATIYKGSVSLESPMLYAFGFIGLFTIGGLTGLFLAAMGLDIHMHDTYFVVAHFHYIMVGGAIMGYLGGLHYWWPKITGRLYSEPWAKLAAVMVFIGFNLTFFPQFVAGYLGMPRRYHEYPPELQVWNVMSSAGASILAVGYIIPLDLPDLLALRGREGAGRSVGRQGTRVGDPLAAADGELRGDADRHRTARTSTRPARRSALSDGHFARRALSRAAPQRRRSTQGAAADESRAHPHHPKLQHHFDDMAQQLEASTLGMWVFLVTEIMFFGGLFMAYLMYRWANPSAFQEASAHLNKCLGRASTPSS